MAIEEFAGINKNAIGAVSIAAGDAAEAFQELTDTHQYPFTIDEAKEARIAQLNGELRRLKDEVRLERQLEAQARLAKIQRARMHLEDPSSSIHPIYREVLVASGMLDNTQTYNGINKLGHELALLSDQLESREDSQPAIVVAEVFNPDSRKFQLQINYGHTKPNTGLNPAVGEKLVSWHSSGTREYGPRPMLELPIETDSMEAISPSTYNSHYVLSSGKVIEVQPHGRRVKRKLAKEDMVPSNDRLGIPLPVASLDVPETARPFVYYERQTGEVDVITMPAVLGESGAVFCAIGRGVVGKALKDLYESRLHMGAEHSRVIKDVAMSIGNVGLGLDLKRGQFVKSYSHRRTQNARV